VWNYFKFRITQIPVEPSQNRAIFQMSEFRLYNSGTLVAWPAGTTVSAIQSGASQNSGEAPGSLIDGNTATKYCEAGNAQNTEIVFKLPLGKGLWNVNSFAMVNANDTASYPNRIPTGWIFYGSSDGTNWKQLNTTTGWTPTTSANYTELPKFNFSTVLTGP
jgi:hypothetical protein